jgi:WD40 repeat protein
MLASEQIQRTALHQAAQAGDLNQVEQLLAAGVNTVAADELGYTALQLAALAGHTTIIKCLLRHSKDEINTKDSTGGTAIRYAASGGHLDMVLCLCEAGADVQWVNPDGSTLLHSILGKPHSNTAHEAFDALLNTLGLTQLEQLMQVQDEAGNNPLHIALQQQSEGMQATLLQHVNRLAGAENYFHQENYAGQTPRSIVTQPAAAEAGSSAAPAISPSPDQEATAEHIHKLIEEVPRHDDPLSSENITLLQQLKKLAQCVTSFANPSGKQYAQTRLARESQTSINVLNGLALKENARLKVNEITTIASQFISHSTGMHIDHVDRLIVILPDSAQGGASKNAKLTKHRTALRIYNLVAFLHKHYKDQIKMQRHTPTLKALKNYYIEQHYSLDITGTTPKKMAVHITAWLREPAPPTLLILGEAGGGKSLLTQDWEQRLWATLEPELHFVPSEQSREEYIRSRLLTSALLYHQQQWWLSYQQGEKIKQLNALSLPPYPFVQLLLQQSYQSLQMDSKQRKKINQGIQYYWLGQQKSYLPIRIPLGDYNAETVLNCVKTHLETIFHHGCLELEQNDLIALRKAVRFLCLFDAYDEIKSTDDQFEHNLYRSNELQHNKAKVLFTCRSQYFDNLRQSNLCFNSCNTEIAPKVYLTQFKLIDIQAYIELYATVNNLDNKAAILRSLTENPTLKELLATPLLLNLYMESYTPGKQPRNRWELYQQLMQGLFERQSRKSNSPSSVDNLTLEYEDASAELAFTLYVENLDVIAKPTQLSNRRQKRRANSPQTETPLATFFSKEAVQTQLRCGHPFKLTATGKYGFIHESFKEFFIATYLLADLEDAVEFKSAQDSWNAKLLPKKPVILRFLREAIEAQSTEVQHTLKTNLLVWVTLKTAKYSNCSANSATLLVQLGECFSKKDLSGAHLVGANLSGGMFDSTNFTKANCSNANFSQAWLRCANFTNAILSNTEWGEYPKLELTGVVKAIYSTATGVTQIATVDRNNIYLWDGVTGEKLTTLEGHTNTVWCLSYRPDGRQLASGSDDHTVRLWNLERGDAQATLEGHTGGVVGLSYSADGRQLASGSHDRTVRLWNLERGGAQATLEGHTSSVFCLSYSADGHQLASGSDDRTVRLWNLERGDAQATLEGHTDCVVCLSYSTDGRQLASGSDDCTVRLWNLERGGAQATLEGHTGFVTCLSYSADGRQLASGSYDCMVRLWDVERGGAQAALEGHTDWVLCMSYRADGRQLASGSSDGTVRLWNVERSGAQATLEGHTSRVLCLSYRADGRQLASGSSDHTVRLWNVERGGAEATLEGHTDTVWCLSYSTDGRQLASGSEDRTVRLWNLERGDVEATLKGHTSRVRCLSYRADGCQLASGSDDRTVRLWNLERGDAETTLEEHTSMVRCLSYSADGRQLASGSDDRTVRLWNLERGCAEATLEGHTSFVTCLSYSADGHQLASGSYDNTVRLWDVEHGGTEATLEGHTFSVLSLSYSPNGRQLASGSYDKTLRIWDPTVYVCLRTLSFHLPIYALAWHNELLALGCNKEIVQLRTPEGSSPEAWFTEWRAALSGVLSCNELKFSGAICSDITRRLLCQHGAVDNSDNSVASSAQAASSLTAAFTSIT